MMNGLTPIGLYRIWLPRETVLPKSGQATGPAIRYLKKAAGIVPLSGILRTRRSLYSFAIKMEILDQHTYLPIPL